MNSGETFFKVSVGYFRTKNKASQWISSLKKTLKRLGLDPVSVFQGHHQAIASATRFFYFIYQSIIPVFSPIFWGRTRRRNSLCVSYKKRLQNLSLAYKQENPKARIAKTASVVLHCGLFCLKPASKRIFAPPPSTHVYCILIVLVYILQPYFAKATEILDTYYYTYLNCQFQGQMWLVQAKNHRTKKLLV